MTSAPEGDRWVLGVVLGLLGSVAINTGNNIQSLGLKQLQERSNTKKSGTRRRSLLFSLHENAKTIPITSTDSEDDDNEAQSRDADVDKVSWTWLMGTVVFVSGSLLNFASYAFAAQSMLASLESIQFVTNLLFGKFLLGAKVTKTMLLGTGLTVMGTVLAVQFSSKATLDLNTEEMKRLYMNPAYIIYLVLMGGLLLGLDFVYRIFERFNIQGAPLGYSETIMPIIYSVWSAVFGTQSVVQAKVLAELLAVQSSGEEGIFRSWFTYVTMILWLLTVVVWLKRLNDALGKFDPLFIIPLLQCSFIFFAIVSGGIFFQEFNTFTASQWLGFWCGVCVMFSGLALLTPRNKKAKNGDLPKEIIDLLLSSGGATHGIHRSIIRPPSTPAPTPRDEEAEDNGKDHMDTIDIESTIDEGEADCASPTNFFRAPRSTREFSKTAVEAMRDVAKETVKGTSLLLTPHQGTTALTEAMVAATAEKEKKLRLKENLKRLRLLLSEFPDGGWNDEAMCLIREVKSHMKAMGISVPSTICEDKEESDRSVMFSPRALQRVIVELERFESPVRVKLDDKLISEEQRGYDVLLPLTHNAKE